MKFERLKCNEIPSVNDPEFDAHHKQLCETANNILELAEDAQTTPEKLLLRLTELGNHVFYHFEAEEKYLKQMHFPAATKHLEAHARYRKEIQGFIAKIREQQRSCKDKAECLRIANGVAQFVSDWVSNHMLGGTDTEKFFTDKRGKNKPSGSA